MTRIQYKTRFLNNGVSAWKFCVFEGLAFLVSASKLHVEWRTIFVFFICREPVYSNGEIIAA